MKNTAFIALGANLKRNQDLSDGRLANETTEDLRKLLKFYYSNEAKNLATSWLQK